MSKRATPVLVEENSPGITLSQGSEGYRPVVFFSLTTWGENPRVRVEWKQKGKVLASIPCTFPTKGVLCKLPNDKPLKKAKGAFQADVIYADDSDDLDYLVRTFNVNVEEIKKDGDKVYIPAADDLLGLATAWHYPKKDGKTTMDDGRMKFQFWIASFADLPSSQLRCTVDGKKIDDINAPIDTLDDNKEVGEIVGGWSHLEVSADILHGSNKDSISKSIRFMDHPGNWDCMLRSEGQVIRQLLFTVNKEGMVDEDELNNGKGEITTARDMVLIDIRIPKDSVDKRIRPDVMKKTVNYGLPWPANAKVKTIHAAFPPKRG